MTARVAVVANPASGRGRALKLIPQVKERLSALGLDAEVLVSRGPADPARLAREAVEGGASIVAAMGGDGMVGMVAGAIAGTEAVLAVIPTGTGNDFARLLGIRRRKPLEAVELLADPRFATIDTARIFSADERERAFVNVAGAGFDSDVTQMANAMRTRLTGTAKYVAALVKVLGRFSPAEFEVSVDGERRSLPAMLVAVGNGRSYGGGMKVCPHASLTDGMLEVCVVGGMSKPEFLAAFPRVFRGSHVTHPKVVMLRGKRIELSADRSFELYADGEPAGPLPATIEVVPESIKVVVPKEASL